MYSKQIEHALSVQRLVLRALGPYQAMTPAALIEKVVSVNDRDIKADDVRAAINTLLGRDVLEIVGANVRWKDTPAARAYRP